MMSLLRMVPSCRLQHNSCFDPVCSACEPESRPNRVTSVHSCAVVYQTRNKTICYTVTVHKLAVAWSACPACQIWRSATAAARCSHKQVSLHLHQHEGSPWLATCKPTFYAPDLHAPPPTHPIQSASVIVQPMHCHVPPAVPRRTHTCTRGLNGHTMLSRAHMRP
jgi:hypothetical protein